MPHPLVRLDDVQWIGGQGVRYLLVLTLLERGEVLTVGELVDALEAAGARLDEDGPRKQVADAIRWEVAKGRVRRVGWGRYAPGTVPRATQWFMRKRVDDLLAGVVR
jgi:hypothetical protein